MMQDVFVAKQTTLEILRGLGEQSFLRRYVAYAMRRTGANPAYHLVNGLGLIATATPHRLLSREILGAIVPSNFWGITVGSSGQDYKTASLTIATELALASLGGRVISDPYSEEGLIKSMAAQSHRLLVAEDWGAALKRWNGGKGSSYASKIKTRLVELYDCSTKTMESANKSLEIINPKLSILTSCNPGYLEEHSLPEDWNGGLYSRFFWCYAKRTDDVEQPEIDANAEAWLVAWLREWAGNTMLAPCLGFTPEARAIWRDWRRAFAQRVTGSGDEIHASMFGRLEAQAARLLLLLAADVGAVTSTTRAPWEITAEAVTGAIALAEINYQSIQRLIGLTVTSPDARLKRKVLKLLSGQGWVSLGTLTDTTGVLIQKMSMVIETLYTERKIEQKMDRDGFVVVRLAPRQPGVSPELLSGLEDL